MIAWLLATAWGADLVTCGDLPSDGCTPTLQDAVDLAVSGDTILVAPGIYDEAVVVDGVDVDFVAMDLSSPPVLTGPESGDETAAALTVRDATVFIDRLAVSATSVRAMRFERAVAWLEGVVLASDALPEQGGLIYAVDSEVEIEQSLLRRGEAREAGGHIYGLDSDIALWRSELYDGFSYRVGGSIAMRRKDSLSTLLLQECELHDNRAGADGGALALFATQIDAFSTELRDNSAQSEGGAIFAESSYGQLQAALLAGNRAQLGGAAYLYNAQIDVLNTSFCGNEITDFATTGVLAVRIAEGGAARWLNNRFFDNLGGGARLYTPGGATTVEIRNNHFVGNVARGGAAIAFNAEMGDVEFSDNLIAFNVDQTPPDIELEGWWFTTVQTCDLCGVTSDHNLWWDNAPSAESRPAFVDEAPVLGDPMLFAYDGDGDCSLSADGGPSSEGWPGWYGAARDAGSSRDTDPDGTQLDIGAFGGSGAYYLPTWDDEDEDGVRNLYDCDPNDPTIGPGLPDTPYDGIDSDCDGWSDFDADRDGFDSDQHGGTDCDDEDPTAFIGAEEIPYDGIDQDCQGGDLDDVDRDGWPKGEDCDDNDPTIFPGALDDVPDVDRNCDGYTDVSRPMQLRGCATGSGTAWGWTAVLALWGRRKKGRRSGDD